MAILQRHPQSNKGSHGALAVVGGAPGTVGAACLASRAALYAGTGRVFMVRPTAGDGFVMDPLAPEVMVIEFTQSLQKPITAWVLGPGLGTSDAAHQIVVSILNVDVPVLIDADALNLIAQDPALGRQCARRSAPTLLTPHPGEAGRLMSVSTEEIQSARTNWAEQIAEKFNAITVLKGAGSVITQPKQPSSPPLVNTTGNAALATAGTGDVLSGLIGGLLAQGMPPLVAAVTGVRIHGLAAEALSQRIGGTVGATASELIPEIRHLINSLPK
jgi:ADP-dependent NAD(P)H-hydrate dehydratase / NAD(P)H-hydrate epimerase